jgi:hypothetical protein
VRLKAAREAVPAPLFRGEPDNEFVRATVPAFMTRSGGVRDRADTLWRMRVEPSIKGVLE